MRSVNDVFFLAGFEPHDRHVVVQSLRIGFSNHFLLSVPPGSLHEETSDIHPILGWCGVLLVVKNFKIERQQVNGYRVFSGKVLFGPRQEGLSEEEPRDPENRRCAAIVPFLEKLESSYEIINIASQWFERWIRLLHPQTRYSTLKNATDNFF